MKGESLNSGSDSIPAKLLTRESLLGLDLCIICIYIELPLTVPLPLKSLFGRPIRDPIPIPMGRYCPHTTWKEILAHRQKALAKRHAREHERWSEHTRLLQPLSESWGQGLHSEPCWKPPSEMGAYWCSSRDTPISPVCSTH